MAKTLIWNITKDAQQLSGYGLADDNLPAGGGYVVADDLFTVLLALGLRATGLAAEKVFSVAPVGDATPVGLKYYATVLNGGAPSSGFADWDNLLNKPAYATEAKPLGISTPGSSAQLARGDHVHAHGEQEGGNQHTVVRLASSDGTITAADGFMSVGDKTKLEGIQLATGSNQAAALPAAVAATASWGVSQFYAAADHTHAHGNLSGGELHAAATASGSGFLSAADKGRIDTYLGRYDILISRKGPFSLSDLIVQIRVPRKIKLLEIVGASAGDVVISVAGSTIAAGDVINADAVVSITANNNLSAFIGALKAVEVP